LFACWAQSLPLGAASPRDADDETLAELCRGHTARLLSWLANEGKLAEPFPRYDGTILSLSRLYQEHPDSPFHDVKHNTRKTYTDSLKVIETTIGQRAVRRVTVVDVRGYYKKWRLPRIKDGADRIKRAHDAVSNLRMILRFGFALGHKDCGELYERLSMLRFERGGAREQEMTFAQVAAFARKALEMGQAGIIPAERAKSMAIGVVAQFDLLLRQKDIIGEWTPARPEIAAAIYASGEMWQGRFRWDNLPGWRLRVRTSKTRSVIEFDLTRYSLLFPLLDSVPHAERRGAIVKGEHGLPIRESSYRKWFRQIARAAGIPDSVWNMDSRAGGATEADEAGADFKAIQDALTHSESRMTMRYIRQRATGRRVASVADARSRKRADDAGEPGTG
jgi:integrase